VQHERDPLGRGQRLQHDQQRHADRLVERDPVGRVGAGLFRQRLREPFADVALTPGPGRAEQVEADPAGDRGQPGAGRLDRLTLLGRLRVPAGVGFLDRVLGLGQRAEQPVGEVDELAALAHHGAQRRIVPWPGLRGHRGRLPRSFTYPDEVTGPNVRPHDDVTFPLAASSDG